MARCRLKDLNEALSLDYISHTITINNEVFNFMVPTTPEEHEEQSSLRHRAIQLLMEDAEIAESFELIDAIIEAVPTREEVMSPIATDSYEEVKLEHKKQVGLNYDAFQVRMQDPSLVFEEEEM